MVCITGILCDFILAFGNEQLCAENSTRSWRACAQIIDKARKYAANINADEGYQ